MDNIIELLKLTTERTLELFAFLIATMNLKKLCADDWGNNLTLFNEKAANLISHLRLSLLLGSCFSGNFTLLSSLISSNSSHLLVFQFFLLLISSCLESLSVLIHAFHDALFNE